jgi:hypothetical protein
MCNCVHERHVIDGYTVHIWIDDDHESPRSYDPTGVLILHAAAERKWWASDEGTIDLRKRLDRAIAARNHVGRGQADFARYLRNFHGAKVVLPVLANADTQEFEIGERDRVDTAWVGFLFDTDESRDWAGTGAGAKADIEQALRFELAMYNRWRFEDCYGYWVLDPAGELLDGTCGYDDTEAALHDAEWAIREERKHAAQAKR